MGRIWNKGGVCPRKLKSFFIHDHFRSPHPSFQGSTTDVYLCLNFERKTAWGDGCFTLARTQPSKEICIVHTTNIEQSDNVLNNKPTTEAGIFNFENLSFFDFFLLSPPP